MMKKIAIAALSFPLTVVLGWLSARLMERFELAMDELEFEFGMEDV